MNHSKQYLVDQANYYQQYWKNGHPIPSIFNPNIQFVHMKRKVTNVIRKQEE